MKLPRSEQLVLASASPRRSDLLHQIAVPHRVLPQDVDESVLEGESARDYVRRIAALKANAALAQLRAEGVDATVLAADTIGVDDEGILLKPADAGAAALMLRRLSGGTHKVLTAIVVANRNRSDRALSDTDVRFAVLSEARIAAYIDSGEWQGKAGAYGIQGRAGAFVVSLNGSYSGVVGLPLHETSVLLERAGVTALPTVAGIVA